MKQFSGFPAKMEFTTVPNLFINSLMPQISDIIELKVSLHIFARLYRKRSYPRFLTYSDMIGDNALINGLKQEGKPEEILRRGLDMAIERGTIIRLHISREGKAEEVFFINSDSDRHVIAKIQRGEFALRGLKSSTLSGETGLEEQPNVFSLYEQNIGMLTPMIVDELREAETLYPETWIKDAIGEAVSLNKRSWRYIARILERWASEGRGDEVGRQETGKTEADKYNNQKYGHMFQR